MENDIFKSKKLVTNNIYIKTALALNLTLPEFLILTYFDNDYNSYLNIEELSKILGLNLEDAYQVFNNLVKKKLLSIDSVKDKEGRMIEVVNLDNFYNLLLENKEENLKREEKTDIYDIFAKEFARPITSIEYEIINAWLEKNYSEEMIKGALKEAVYNGVSNLRYIDKILYEWNKKGFKSMNDVDKHLKNEDEKKEDNNHELFDYNWLEDEE